jgi:hypothetical protein
MCLLLIHVQMLFRVDNTAEALAALQARHDTRAPHAYTVDAARRRAVVGSFLLFHDWIVPARFAVVLDRSYGQS